MWIARSSNPVGALNIHVAIAPQGYLLELVRTDATMRPIDEATQADWDLVEKGIMSVPQAH